MSMFEQIRGKKVKKTPRLKLTTPDEINYYLAHQAVHDAIKSGDLEPLKYQQCASWGISCFHEANVYHHTHGYAPQYWLHVIPLCHSCHRKLHTSKS